MVSIDNDLFEEDLQSVIFLFLYAMHRHRIGLFYYRKNDCNTSTLRNNS